MADAHERQHTHEYGLLERTVLGGVGIEELSALGGLIDRLREEEIGAGADLSMQVLDLVLRFRSREIEGGAHEEVGGLAYARARVIDPRVEFPV